MIFENGASSKSDQVNMSIKSRVTMNRCSVLLFDVAKPFCSSLNELKVTLNYNRFIDFLVG